MSAMKPLALGVLVWAASLSVVRADPITWPSGMNWTAYFAGENAGGGANFAPASPSPSPAVSAPVVTQPVSTPAVTPAVAPAVTPAVAPAATPAVAPAVVPAVSSAPAQPATPISLLANAPVAQPQPQLITPVSTAPATSGPVDAFINLGNGPYPLANVITNGGAQPWYNSSQIASLFGGQPTSQQIQSFDNAILARVQQTFSSSGVSVTLTDNPAVQAMHTLSLVSNTASASMSNAIGMTQIGSSGFSFLDKMAPSAQSVDQLEWIVAHNISHELMLAFGVPENYDQTGNYVDSRAANWSMMVNPSATFSPAAAQALTQALTAENHSYTAVSLGAQEIGTVPEPTTVALWVLAGAAALVTRHVRARKDIACS